MITKKRKFEDLDRNTREEAIDSIAYPSDTLTRGQIRALDIAFDKHKDEKSKSCDRDGSSDLPDWGTGYYHGGYGYDRMTIDDLHREERELVYSVMSAVSEGRYYRLDSPDFTKRLKDYYTRFGAFGTEQVDEKAIDAAIQSVVNQAKEKAKELVIEGEPISEEKPPVRDSSFTGRVRFSEGAERAADKGF